MIILHIVDSLERGGQESFLVDLAITQKEMGHAVSIMCLRSNGVLGEKAIAHDIHVSTLEIENASKIRIFSFVRSMIARINPDVVHAHNRFPLIAVICSMAKYKARVINTRHGNGVRGLYWSVAALFAHKIVNVSDEVYNQSNFFNRLFYNKKNVIIRNGINVIRPHTRGDNPGSIIMVGRLHEVKNHSFALRIIRECVNLNIPIKMRIAGDGPEYENIVRDIRSLDLEGVVSILGDRGDIPELLAESDIFLLTSMSEGHSIALLEATAAGLPSVVTNVGGNSEITQHGVTGYVLPLGDVTSFVKAIRMLIENRKTWECYSENASRWSQHNASMTSCAMLYENVYQYGAKL